MIPWKTKTSSLPDPVIIHRDSALNAENYYFNVFLLVCLICVGDVHVVDVLLLLPDMCML